MELGKYHKQNQNRITLLSEQDWNIVLNKCKVHIKWKLRQKTLSGAHTASRLGVDPIDHYLGISYEKILTGEWEWKEGYTLLEQMIRIIDSYISAEVEKKKTKKEQSFKVDYFDNDNKFYDRVDPPDSMEEEMVYTEKLQIIENAIKGDSQLEILMDAVKEGMKRAEIAALMDLHPRQLEKVRERLIRTVRNYQSSLK